jgi:XTP/dITP diphosphohydrolase
VTTVSVPARRTVVVATGNRGKLHELRELLADLPIDLKSMAEALPRKIEIVEDAPTFEGNARKKARLVADACAMPVLADDSGLEVDALDGAPGVRSARYAGEGATDAENNRKLLTALEEHGQGPRTARFRCVIVLHDPLTLREPLVADGTCEGKIETSPRGTHGFGYDPIFVVRDVPGGRTMAELSDAEKNAVSHRGKAIAALRARLRVWLGLS